MPDIAKATLKFAVMNLKFSNRFAVYCEPISTAPPAAPIRKYAALTNIGSLVEPSSAYAMISEIIMMVTDQRAPMTSMNAA